MTSDQYFDSILVKHRPMPLGLFGTPLNVAITALTAEMRSWAGAYASAIDLSGSYAKGTAISGNSDVDLFVSLNHNVLNGTWTLNSIYENLYTYLQQRKYTVKKQNVSIHVQYKGVEVDLVPGVRQTVIGSDHSLWSNRSKSWIKTNIQTHVNAVKSSGRSGEMRAVKIWRKLNALDFPSIYLELSVINALSSRTIFSSRASNFLEVLEYLQRPFLTARIVDPANSNNIISDDLTMAEKRRIADQAAISRAKKNWETIIW
jgi:predicted nucleotidyltransferase